MLTIIPVFFPTVASWRWGLLRVMRIFHVFRINSKLRQLQCHEDGPAAKEQTDHISPCVIIFILMMASSLCMYSTEQCRTAGSVQAERLRRHMVGGIDSPYRGYGDIYPITLLGKCMAIVIAFMGVVLVAIPTGIISAGFVEQYQNNANEESKVVDVDEIGELLVDGCEQVLRQDHTPGLRRSVV